MNQELSIFKIIALALTLGLCAFQPAFSDTLVVEKDDEEVSLEGELLFKARDKSILFESTDGQLHVFTDEQIVSLEEDIEVTPSMDHLALGKSLLPLRGSTGFSLRKGCQTEIQVQAVRFKVSPGRRGVRFEA